MINSRSTFTFINSELACSANGKPTEEQPCQHPAWFDLQSGKKPAKPKPFNKFHYAGAPLFSEASPDFVNVENKTGFAFYPANKLIGQCTITRIARRINDKFKELGIELNVPVKLSIIDPVDEAKSSTHKSVMVSDLPPSLRSLSVEDQYRFLRILVAYYQDTSKLKQILVTEFAVNHQPNTSDTSDLTTPEILKAIIQKKIFNFLGYNPSTLPLADALFESVCTLPYSTSPGTLILLSSKNLHLLYECLQLLLTFINCRYKFQGSDLYLVVKDVNLTQLEICNLPSSLMNPPSTEQKVALLAQLINLAGKCIYAPAPTQALTTFEPQQPIPSITSTNTPFSFYQKTPGMPPPPPGLETPEEFFQKLHEAGSSITTPSFTS